MQPGNLLPLHKNVHTKLVEQRSPGSTGAKPKHKFLLVHFSAGPKTIGPGVKEPEHSPATLGLIHGLYDDHAPSRNAHGLGE